jgi:hypothetical protein
MSTAVANAKETAVSTDVMDDIFEFAGEGAAFDSSEMQIPFIRLLQPLSPQLNKKKAEFIEGASSGDAFNNVTGQHWDGEKGISVIVCFQTTKYLEFVPRDSGGGFKGEINPASHLLQQTSRQGSKEILPNGNELVKSDQHFCLGGRRRRQLSARGDRHEVDYAKGQPPLEDADRHAEGQKPEDRCADDPAGLCHDVASVRRGGV